MKERENYRNMKRASGILFHITSLPGRFGVGTLGKAAYDFVDFLKKAGQTYWQLLPITPTSYGDSPYQSPCTFAGNPYLVDLEQLIAEGLLTEEECDRDWCDDPLHVHYGKLYENRYAVLRKAFSRFNREEMLPFCEENRDWVYDYALFTSLKSHFHGKPWYEWEDKAIANRDPQAMEYYRQMLYSECAFHCFIQYEFDRQWKALRTYCKEKGILLIGDVPIYVPHDSADMWMHPDLFSLDEQRNPIEIAGVPPDAFSSTGQLWGTPVYRWDVHKQDNYAWWVRRIGAMQERFDLIRIDHFRGLESYWSVPNGSPDASVGEWVKGPGMDLIRAIKAAHPSIRIIAEDLGYLTPEVKRLLSDSGFPGMRVLQFGFEPYGNSRDLPHNYPIHSIAYTGTHDNSPMMGWVETAPAAEVAFAVDYLGLNEREGMAFGFIRGILNSPAELAVAQLQDYLGLGEESRMNRPGTLGWWQYRAKAEDFGDELAARILHYTKLSGRA